MTTALEGIERARALARLLQAKEQAKTSEGMQKAQIIKEILELRQRLFQETTTKTGVVDRIAANPIDLSKTLETKEYAEIMQTWLPDSTIAFDGVEAENAKGFAIALSSVLTTYPKLAESGLLKFASSGRGVNRLRKTREKEAQAVLDKAYGKFTQTDVHKNLIEAFYEAFDQKAKTAEEMTRWYGARQAHKFAEWFGLNTDTEVKRLLASDHGLDKTFISACKIAYAHRRARDEFDRAVKKEQPGIFNTGIPRFTGATSKRHYAAYYFGYGVIVSDQFKDNLNEKINRDISLNWHPKGTGGDSPEIGAKNVTTHELGHAMDDLLGLSKNTEILRVWRSYGRGRIAEELSDYAATKIQEMIAEAFCEYHVSAIPRPLAAHIGKIIDQAYKDKFGGE